MASFHLFTLFTNGGLFALAITTLVFAILGLIGVYIYKQVKNNLDAQIEKAKEGIVNRANIEATGKQLQSFANQAYYAYNTYKRCSEHTTGSKEDQKATDFNTDAWQNYAFMDIAISLSEMAIESADVIKELFSKGNRQHDINYPFYELIDVYAHCNLSFYYAERLKDECFFSNNDITESRSVLLKRLKTAEQKLSKAKKQNERVVSAWHHLKESLIHAEYYVDKKLVKQDSILRKKLKQDIIAVLEHALALGERGWREETAAKWAAVDMYSANES